MRYELHKLFLNSNQESRKFENASRDVNRFSQDGLLIPTTKTGRARVRKREGGVLACACVYLSSRSKIHILHTKASSLDLNLLPNK